MDNFGEMHTILPVDVKKILITGGAGFIGGNLIRRLLKNTNVKIYNLDKIGYASDRNFINESYLSKTLEINEDRYKFLKVDLGNEDETFAAIEKASPDLIMHLAAESHVDRSIDSPNIFIRSNVYGTFNLLQAVKKYWSKLSSRKKDIFKFHHISTDEVFGSLGIEGYFNENSLYRPRSPYSASKAASDHFVNAWHETYNIPTLITNCSNNFGPYQYPEKLIPLAIMKGLKKESIPLYGEGTNIRDWLYVEDHIDALLLVLSKGKIGESYCIGGFGEISNKNILESICKLLNDFSNDGFDHTSLIKKVADRPGHDFRYAIDSSKIKTDLGWRPKYKLSEGLEKTVKWYFENQAWCMSMIDSSKYI